MNPTPTALEPPADMIEETSRTTMKEIEDLGETTPTDTTLPLTPSASKNSLSTSTPKLLTPSPPSSTVPATMANFVVDSEPFIPPVMVIEDGGPLRRACREVYIKGGVTKSHDNCGIVVVNGEIFAATHHHILHDITNYIVTQHQLIVGLFALHPHGIGIYKMRNACQWML
jgi:hypothetical protein